MNNQNPTFPGRQTSKTISNPSSHSVADKSGVPGGPYLAPNSQNQPSQVSSDSLPMVQQPHQTSSQTQVRPFQSNNSTNRDLSITQPQRQYYQLSFNSSPNYSQDNISYLQPQTNKPAYQVPPLTVIQEEVGKQDPHFQPHFSQNNQIAQSLILTFQRSDFLNFWPSAFVIVQPFAPGMDVNSLKMQFPKTSKTSKTKKSLKKELKVELPANMVGDVYLVLYYNRSEKLRFFWKIKRMDPNFESYKQELKLRILEYAKKNNLIPLNEFAFASDQKATLEDSQILKTSYSCCSCCLGLEDQDECEKKEPGGG